MSVLAAVLAAAGVVLAAALGAAGAIITARGQSRSSPYDALADRVMHLEEQHDGYRTKITSLERRLGAVIDDRDALVAYIARLREWVSAGAKPPAPQVPQHLRDVIPDWTPADEHHG